MRETLLSLFLSIFFLGEYFAKRFPDSTIAKTFQCGETKSAYICKFGLAPHFKQLLSSKLKDDDYVLLFDESLNVETQSKQCDFLVRHWDGNKVMSRFYDSQFMGHAMANDLKKTYEKSTEELSKSEMLQISMDGPNVNWSFYSKVEQSLQNNHGVCLINIGRCGLHVVHGAFQKGVEDTKWKLDSFLKALHQLLKNSPARREDYRKAVGSNDSPMPLKFCKTRWIENRPFLERALEILPEMSKYVKAIESKKFPDPGTKSFETINEAIKDSLMAAKINFVLSVSKEVTPFLTLYQTDKPMVPFLAKDLFQLLKSLLCRFLKPIVMKFVMSVDKLLDVNIGLDANQLDHTKVYVGFSAERITKQLSLEFRVACKACLVSIVKKLLEKSPLKYSLVSNLRFLDPRMMCNLEAKDLCIKLLKRALTYLVNQKRIKEEICDEVVQQYQQFVDEVVEGNQSGFSEFNPLTDRVDSLLHELMSKDKRFEKLWRLCRKLLLLSHGQASVERGFSVNRQIETENMKDETYVARRRICDHVRAVGGIHNVIVDKSLLLSISAARQRYMTNLENQKRLNKEKEKGKKRKSIEDEIEKLKTKKRRLSADEVSLEQSANKAAVKAGKTRNLTLITKSNSLRRSAKEKKDKLKQVEEKLNEKLLELKNC